MKRLIAIPCVLAGVALLFAQPSPHMGELLRAHRRPELKHRSGLTNLDWEIPQLITVRRAYILKNVPEGRTPVRCWQMTAGDATNTLWLTTNAANLMLIEMRN